MADRTTLTKTVSLGAYATPVIATENQADAVNKNRILLSGDGKELVIFRNFAATPRVVTITSVDNQQGRSEDIVFTLGNLEERIYGPIKYSGWAQVGPYLHLEGAHADVRITVVTLP